MSNVVWPQATTTTRRSFYKIDKIVIEIWNTFMKDSIHNYKSDMQYQFLVLQIFSILAATDRFQSEPWQYWGLTHNLMRDKGLVII